MLDIALYLRRLDSSWKRPSVAYLKELQRAHQRAIPIENFDIFLGNRRSWDVEGLSSKVIGGSRGGLGIELNAIFGDLLTQLGFRCMYVGAYHSTKAGAQPKHMVIVVNLENGLWLVDVGSRQELLDPVAISEAQFTLNFSRYVRTKPEQQGWWRFQISKDAVNFTDIYYFKVKESKLIEFLHLHDELQNIYESPMAQEKIISRISDTGRITLTPRHLKRLQGGEVHIEETIHNEQAFDEALRHKFGMSWLELIQ